MQSKIQKTAQGAEYAKDAVIGFFGGGTSVVLGDLQAMLGILVGVGTLFVLYYRYRLMKRELKDREDDRAERNED